jgi:hypothetical protein
VTVTNTTGVQVGMWVFAVNVPDGTTVASFVPDVSITLSNPVTSPGVLNARPDRRHHGKRRQSPVVLHGHHLPAALPSAIRQ